MRFGSLFSGIGGLDLGLERAGMTCAWQVEIDEWCRRVLAWHWPDVPRFGDVRDVHSQAAHVADPERLRRAATTQREVDAQSGGARQDNLTGGTGCDSCLAPVDLICGGFPCQPVSLAGKRRGQDDERWLWPEFARIVRLLRPRYVLVENVPGLLAQGMGDVLGDLAASGYDTEWDCIPAAAVGAPHLRYRVFIVGYRSELGPRSAVPDAERRELRDEREWDQAPEQGHEGAPIAGDDGPQGSLAHGNSWGREGERSGGLRDRQRPALGDDADGRRGALADDDSEGWSDAQGRAGSPPRRGSVFGPNPAQLGSDQWISEPDVGRVAHGVPSRVDRLRGLGNAVVPQVAEWIGRRLMERVA